MEVASNDGYLLRHVVERGIPALGIEPAANVAEVARELGIETIVRFFGRELAADLVAEGRRADLIAANNVMAHVPDLNDFVAGFEMVLAPQGVVTIEVPHLLRLVEENQFDTIYHEHFQYFSFLSAQKVLAAHGLEVFDVERAQEPRRLAALLRPAGGHRHAGRSSSACTSSSRASARSASTRSRATWRSPRRSRRPSGACSSSSSPSGARASASPATARPARATRCSTTAGSAPTCSTTRSTGTRTSRASSCPGTHIPILHPEVLEQDRPDYILILPWNLKQEIVAQLEYAREWGAQFIVPIPKVEVL